MWYDCLGFKDLHVELGLNVLLIPELKGLAGIQSVIRHGANGSGGQDFLNRQFRRFFTPNGGKRSSYSVQLVLVTPRKINTGAIENVERNRSQGKILNRAGGSLWFPIPCVCVLFLQFSRRSISIYDANTFLLSHSQTNVGMLNGSFLFVSFASSNKLTANSHTK